MLIHNPKVGGSIPPPATIKSTTCDIRAAELGSSPNATLLPLHLEQLAEFRFTATLQQPDNILVQSVASGWLSRFVPYVLLKRLFLC